MVNVEKLNRILIIILKICYLNFLWVLGTLAGLVLIGIGPSTAAVFSIAREWLRGNDDSPVLKSFIDNYRAYFRESLMISLAYGLTGTILVIDYIYMTRLELKVFFGIMLFLYLISLTYIFPVMVHYDLPSIKEKIRYSFLIGFSYLQYTLVLYVAAAGIYFSVARFYPALFTFFGFSFLIVIIMKTAYIVFSRIEASVEEEQMETNKILKNG